MFQSDGCVLITGGLGKVGLAIARWMIEKRHVRHVVLMARRNPDELHERSAQKRKWNDLVRVAQSHSASVEVVKSDVGNYDDVRRVITQINDTALPLRGIIHAALVLRDSLALNMTTDMLVSVMRPRIRGAWNLHKVSSECLPKLQLQFFVLLSSLRNHVIDIGGANYNATNEFFDALAHWRRDILHEPALSVSVPFVFGYTAEDDDEERSARLHSVFKGIPFQTLFELIECFHDQQQYPDSTTTPIIFTVDWHILKNEMDYSKTARIRELVDKQITSSEQKELESTELEQSVDNDSISFKLVDKIQEVIAKIFGSTNIERIDKEKPLVEQGLDSLMAVALHNWIGAHCNIFLPVFDIIQGMSIHDIIEQVKTRLLVRSQVDNKTSAPNLSDQVSLSNAENDITTLPPTTSLSKIDYCGTSFIKLFPMISSTRLDHLTLFCVPSMTTTDSDDQNCFHTTRLSSKLQHVSQICIFQKTNSLKDVVQEYILQMRRLQPRGPYFLMGYGTGACIACEMCANLRTSYDNAHISKLILVHPVQPQTSKQEYSQEKTNKEFSSLSADYTNTSASDCEVIVIESKPNRMDWSKVAKEVEMAFNSK